MTDLLREIHQLRTLLTRQRNRAYRLERSRDMWKQRARAAEWALRRAGL